MRRAIALLMLAGCARPAPLDAARFAEREPEPRLAPVSANDRNDDLARARIFFPVDIAARDLLAGPPDPDAFALDESVSCDYVAPRPDLVFSPGTTPKFFCALRHHHHQALVKVKYGRGNREPVGELLGSRLLWALGVAVDHDYAVSLRCHDCPRDPWRPLRDYPKDDGGPRDLLRVESAVIQRLYPGATIEECTRSDGGECRQRRQDQGWTFDELARVDPEKGGASAVEVDALRLLAAFIAHGDDKPSNQRLVCPFADIDGDGKCRAPRLLIGDLGSTFGRGANGLGMIDNESRPSLRAWSSLPVWEDRAACRAHLSTRSSRPNPIVSDAGRRFLVARLMQLSDAQLYDLFTAARVESLGESVRDPDGRLRAVTVDDWVAAFKTRRARLAQGCH